MEKIKIIIDWCDRNYGASVEDDRIGGAVVATHKTHEGILAAIEEALRFHVETAVEDGDELPAWLVDGEYELCFEYSTAAIIRRSESFTTLSAISRASGINPQQLSHYANGVKRPRSEQRERILQGIHALGRELLAVV